MKKFEWKNLTCIRILYNHYHSTILYYSRIVCYFHLSPPLSRTTMRTVMYSTTHPTGILYHI